jgi:hypothetical protein
MKPVSLRATNGSEAIFLKDCFVASLLAMTLGICGCQTPKPKPQSETVSALTSVTQGLTNKPVTEEQLKDIARQVANDPQAQSALKSIDTAFTAEHTVKYCPENGERFSPDMEWCPDHKVKLEWVD